MLLLSLVLLLLLLALSNVNSAIIMHYLSNRQPDLRVLRAELPVQQRGLAAEVQDVLERRA